MLLHCSSCMHRPHSVFYSSASPSGNGEINAMCVSEEGVGSEDVGARVQGGNGGGRRVLSRERREMEGGMGGDTG